MHVKEVLSALLKQSSLIVLLMTCKLKFIPMCCNIIQLSLYSYISGREMKCTIKLEDHQSTPVRENAIMLVN